MPLPFVLMIIPILIQNQILLEIFIEKSVTYRDLISPPLFSEKTSTFTKVIELRKEQLCEPCNFHVIGKGNSSPLDVVLTASSGKMVGLGGFMRTLRTTGCKASVVLFADKQALEAVPSYTYEQCGLTIITLENLLFEPHFMMDFRFYLYHDFLLPREKLFHRVLAVDVFDTVFQGDPFTENINSDSLVFSYETLKIKDSYMDTLWIKNYVGDIIYDKISMNRAICSGLVIGGITPYIEFLKEYIIPIDEILSKDVYDQAMINVLIYNRSFCERHKCNFSEPFQHYGTIGYMIHSTKILTESIGSVHKKGTSFYPLVLHQADRSTTLINDVIKHCPSEKNNDPNLVRNSSNI